MTLNNAVTAFAGVMVIVSLLLTHYVHPNFVWFTAFIGFNLFQQSFTGFCPAAMIFKAMGLKNS
jgi:hypothetical protein